MKKVVSKSEDLDSITSVPYLDTTCIS